MRIAPLIHSRTAPLDFNSHFAVRPTGFANYVEWARTKILPATRNVERIRKVIAANGKGICFTGVACTMEFFVDNYLKDAEKKEAAAYILKGRPNNMFLGYVFESKSNEIPDIKEHDLWEKIFLEYLAPQWNNPLAETIEEGYFDWDKVKKLDNANISPSGNAFGAQLYDVAQVDLNRLFDEYLFKALSAKEEMAFCSNVTRIKTVEERIYTAITTSMKNITSLEYRWRQQELKRQRELERQRGLEEKKKFKINTSQPNYGTLRSNGTKTRIKSGISSIRSSVEYRRFSVDTFLDYLNRNFHDSILIGKDNKFFRVDYFKLAEDPVSGNIQIVGEISEETK